MHISSHTLSRVFFVLTIAILLFISYFSYIRIQNLIASNKSVYHTNEVRYELEKISSILKDAETGQRGFIITNDSLFLDPYIWSREKVDRSLNRLDTLFSDNRQQQKNMFVLRKLVQMRYMAFEESLGTNQFKDKKLFRKNMLYGKNLMDQVRYEIAMMLQTENVLLKERNEIRNSYESVTPLFLLTLTLFSLILISASYFIIRKQLTERIRFQHTLEENISELNRSNSELEQFAYVASHDLQEPLRKIQSFGDRLLLKHKDSLNEDGLFIAERMRSSAERMQGLINDLLSFSRLMQSKKQVKETVDLNKTVSNILGDLQMVMDKKKATVKLKSLPVLFAVPSQMHQLFQNLISNALKFTKEDVAPIVEVKSEIVKRQNILELRTSKIYSSYHKITITDNGIGFDEQYLEKIFIIFQRLHGKLEYEGTGIGLAVCKKIIANHDGYLTAKSKLGEGASFIIYLPVTENKKL